MNGRDILIDFFNRVELMREYFEEKEDNSKLENIRDFVLDFYRDAEFCCIEYCDKTDDYSERMYWKHYERRASFREMLVKLGFTWDAINDLDNRLLAEYARKHRA